MGARKFEQGRYDTFGGIIEKGLEQVLQRRVFCALGRNGGEVQITRSLLLVYDKTFFF